MRKKREKGLRRLETGNEEKKGKGVEKTGKGELVKITTSKCILSLSILFYFILL